MNEPVLVVDFGTTTSSAMVLDGPEEFGVPEPASGGYLWPSTVCWDGDRLLVGTLAERRRSDDPTAYWSEFKRGLAADTPVLLGHRWLHPTELVTALLGSLRAEAERHVGRAIDRAVLAVPVGYGPGDPRRTHLLAAAQAAGLSAVELVAEPVAAASAAALVPGELVLVYDLGGGSFDVAVLRAGDRTHDVVGHAWLDDCAGRDVDALLATRIRVEAEQWLTPLRATVASSPDAPAALRLSMAVTEFARRVKHQLSDAVTTRDALMPNSPPYQLSRQDFAVMAGPLLRRTVDCSVDLLMRLGLRTDEISAVLMCGGGSRMPIVAEVLERGLSRPLRRMDAPDLAVVRGAAQWVRRSGSRVLPAARTPPRTVPLSFAIRDGGGRLLRWLVLPGDEYGAGSTLARVRLPDGALWDLTAAEPGMLDRALVAPGAEVSAGDWLALARPPRSS
jgi:molecular chaperone DnaK (HSP70)